MFFTDETTSTSSFEPTQGKGEASFATRAAKEAAAALNPKKFVQAYKEIENLATETARKVFGQVGSSSDYIQKTTANAYRNTISIGASLKDNFDIYQAIGASLQRNTYLTESQLEDLVTIQQTTSLTAEEIGKMVTGFQDLGQGTDKAIETTQKLTKTARTYGLNVNTFLKSVGENIKLVNSYGFKDGVEGLGRMVARAQALRMNFGEVKGLAAELLSPEKAIELAATMQTLGGEIGALGDFGQLMYMAENDMEGLQNSIIDAAKSAVMFNEETGEFKITGVEMRRLREQARALGLNYEDLANTAVKAAKEQKVMESLDFTGLNQDQKQLIANLSEIGTNGQIKLNVPGFENVADVTKLTKDQFTALEEYQKTANMSEKQIASQSLSIEREQLAQLRSIASGGILAGDYLSSEPGTKGEDLESLMRTISTVTGEETRKTLTSFVETGEFTTAVTSFVTGSSTFLSDLESSFVLLIRNLDDLIKKLPTGYRSGLDTRDPATATEPENVYRDSLDTLTVKVDGIITAISQATGINASTFRGTTSLNDGFFPAGTAKVISGPEGTFRLPNGRDEVLVGTNLFGGQESSNSNINFGSPLKIDINIAGVTNQDFANMMKSNEFTAAVRRQLLSGIGSPLGNTTAGYV